MRDDVLTYEGLQHAAGKQLLRYTLLHGQGGFLVFLWSLGVAGFVLLLDGIGLTVVWTVASAGILAMLMRNHAKNRASRETILRAVMEARFPRAELPDTALELSFQRAIGIYAEIALKIADCEKAHGESPDLRRVFTDGDGMLRLQLEASKQAVEFERALALIDAAASGRTAEASKLREESRVAVETEAAEARSLAGSIFRGLEVLLLQVFQMEKGAADMVRTAEFARETNASLQRMQEQLSARRAVAQSVLQQ